MFSILLLGSIGISAYAQGTWKTTGTEAAIASSTAITMTGITGLECMHSDLGTILGKTDAGAPSVSYHGVNWDNPSYVQGSTNGMYFAFRSTSDGILDIPVKMSANKKTFILELTSDCPYQSELENLTAFFATGDKIWEDPTTSYFTLPSVYDTYNNTTGTWNGTVSINTSSATQYMVMSFPVLANKTYVVGVLGSKLQLKGVNYIVTTSIKETPATKGISYNGTQVLNEKGQKIELYNMSGRLITRSSSSISTDNLPKGVYVVRTTGSNGVMKFIK